MKELKEVRKKGYAVNDQELSTLIRTFAAPIFDMNGHALAAIGVTVPTTAYNRKQLEENLGPKVIEAAQKTTDALSKVDDVKFGWP